jgi:hypothetical protein
LEHGKKRKRKKQVGVRWLKTHSMKTETLGYCKGDLCNRDGCNGIIDEHEKEGGCSCHINPPCGYCTTSTEYCPKCEWDGREEQMEHEYVAAKNTDVEYWQKQQREFEERRNKLQAQMRGELPVEKFDYENLGHTHFSMVKQGVYPNGMTREEVLSKVNGTFGGRFEYFGENKFKFIAYTD